MQYARNPGAAETVGILYWKLCWWRTAKNVLKEVSRFGWIEGRDEYASLFELLRSLIDSRSAAQEPGMHSWWMVLREFDVDRLKKGPDTHYPEGYWNELADWLFSSLYFGVCRELGRRSGDSTDDSAMA